MGPRFGPNGDPRNMKDETHPTPASGDADTPGTSISILLDAAIVLSPATLARLRAATPGRLPYELPPFGEPLDDINAEMRLCIGSTRLPRLHELVGFDD